MSNRTYPRLDARTMNSTHKSQEEEEEEEEGNIASWEVIGYSVVTPAICGLGMLANTCSLIVLLRGADYLRESLYTYLKVLSAADLVTVTLVFLSGLARGVWLESFFWRCYDELFHLPVGSISSSVSITTLVTVTTERVVIIGAPLSFRAYCTPSFARKICAGNVVFSVIFNIPYFFTFMLKEDHLVYSPFSQSTYYSVHNWFRLVLLGMVPVVTLLLGNLFLLHSLWRPRRPFLPARSPSATAHQRRLTWVLIAMVFSFLLGEFPTHIASRSSAISLLFSDKPEMFNTFSFRIFKVTATVLMSLHYSINFFLYCAFNKRFAQQLRKLLPQPLSCSYCSSVATRVGPTQVPLEASSVPADSAPVPVPAVSSTVTSAHLITPEPLA